MIYKKPDLEVFASGAKSGELVEFPDVARGWGVTENTGFIPPMEYFNGAFNRLDKNILYLLQNGIMAWDSSLEYPTGALTQIEGVIYCCVEPNTNQSPANGDERYWKQILATRSHVADELKKLDAKFLPLTGKAADSDKLDGKDSLEFVLKSELKGLMPNVESGLKIGSYLLWSSQSVTPSGFLVCDGRSLNKSEYLELFNVIGYTYGGSEESFNIPNFSDGKFFRSVGGNAAALGTAQTDAIRNITGMASLIDYELRDSLYFNGAFASNNSYTTTNGTENSASGAKHLDVKFDASKVVPTANENRPYNMSVVVLIKVKDVKEPNANQIDNSIYASEVKAGIVKLKNEITGDAIDAAITENVASKIRSIGIAQTLQNVTSQRHSNVTYTNTTGRPIQLLFSSSVNLVINNITIYTANAIIPPDLAYKTTSKPSVWLELRS